MRLTYDKNAKSLQQLQNDKVPAGSITHQVDASVKALSILVRKNFQGPQSQFCSQVEWKPLNQIAPAGQRMDFFMPQYN